LQRHLEAGGKARKGAASDAEGGARGGCWWDGSDCAGTLTKQNANGAQRMPDKDNFGAVLQPTAYRWQNDRDGLQQDDAVAALRASAGNSGFHEMNHPVIAQPVPFTKAKRAQSVTDDETWVQGQVNPTLSLFDQAPLVALFKTMSAEQCVPTEGTITAAASRWLFGPPKSPRHLIEAARTAEAQAAAIKKSSASTARTLYRSPSLSPRPSGRSP